MGFTRPVVDGVFESIIAVAESTKTAEQAFADFLQGIASMLFDIGKQIIAQYIAIGIARKFAGIPGIGGGLEPKTDVGNAAFMDRVFSLDLAGKAAGGPVSAGRPYLVGERGPELFMPRTSGSIYPNDAMGMGGANIVVNVDAGGSSVGGDPGQANQLGKAIGIAVQQELIKQKRPGGLLA
jgi:phage-related minor tail protein